MLAFQPRPLSERHIITTKQRNLVCSIPAFYSLMDSPKETEMSSQPFILVMRHALLADTWQKINLKQTIRFECTVQYTSFGLCCHTLPWFFSPDRYLETHVSCHHDVIRVPIAADISISISKNLRQDIIVTRNGTRLPKSSSLLLAC